MTVSINLSDLSDPQHAEGLLNVLDSYAQEPAGGGQPLPDAVRAQLISKLQEHTPSAVFLAELDGQIVGAAVCFQGLSTFQAKPLLNIHDLAVLPEFRGMGIGRALLKTAEAEANERGCCKLTLEVQDSNSGARRLYASCGFVDFELGEPIATRFLSKQITPGA